MRVFYASASFAPSYGGPAYSVSRLASHVRQAGAETALWAPDGSAADLELPQPSPARLKGTLREALADFGAVDVLHDSGLWRPHNHALAAQARRIGTPLVVSTRGMLDPWALRHKWLRKAVAWQVYQRRDLNLASVLHVTSRQEMESVGRLGLRAPMRLIANGVDLPDQTRGTPGDGPRRVVFLGRLHPIKGLTILIEAWGSLRPDGWELVLAGPDESGFQCTLEAQVASLGLNHSVHFAGPVSGVEKDDLLRGATFFVLPSLSESFGMVVAEACAVGLPVVTTTAVPWPELEEYECGFRSAPNARALAATLIKTMRLPEATLASMGQRGREFVKANFNWASVSQQFIGLYEGLTMLEQSRNSRPTR